MCRPWPKFALFWTRHEDEDPQGCLSASRASRSCWDDMSAECYWSLGSEGVGQSAGRRALWIPKWNSQILRRVAGSFPEYMWFVSTVSFFLARKFHRLWQILPKDIEVSLCFFRDLQQNGNFCLHLFNKGFSDGEANPIPSAFGEMVIMLQRSWWHAWCRLWSRTEGDSLEEAVELLFGWWKWRKMNGTAFGKDVF